MEPFEKYAAKDGLDICVDYISHFVHFLEKHAARLGIEDELDKFKSILDDPHDSQDLIFILSEIEALLGSGSPINMEWIRDEEYSTGIISKAA
jgi:hypothetical protein